MTTGQAEHVMQASLIREVFDVDVSIVKHPRHGRPSALL
jgi:ABC-type cobalamin/Fe3+-siderophores transport system ATPase subunit